MHLADKLIRVERTIGIYNKTDKIEIDLGTAIKEINIDIQIDSLKAIISPKEDDPLLYDIYVLDSSQIDILNGLLISLPKIQTTGLVNFFCNLTISNEKANTSKIFAGFQGPGGA